MSVDALKQVYGDPSPLSPGVQAVCLAVAWRTPPGRDSTWPISYREMADLTHYHRSSIRRIVLEAISTGAIELVWARRGEASRYRINRGEWHVPTDPAVIEKALAALVDKGTQGALDVDRMSPDPKLSEPGTGPIPLGDPKLSEPGHRKKKIEEEEDATGVRPMLVDVVDPDPEYVARWSRSLPLDETP